MTLTVLIHINGIRASRFGLGVGINFSRSKLADIFSTRPMVFRPGKPHFLILLRLRLIQQFLITLQTLRRRSTDNRRYCSPLRGHELCEM
jgi:hypothetical protein